MQVSKHIGFSTPLDFKRNCIVEILVCFSKDGDVIFHLKLKLCLKGKLFIFRKRVKTCMDL